MGKEKIKIMFVYVILYYYLILYKYYVIIAMYCSYYQDTINIFLCENKREWDKKG